MLRTAARAWLGDRYPAERVAALADSAAGWDPAVWGQLQQLGWVDSDLTPLDTALLFEETGYALLPAPLFSSVALGVPGAPSEAPSTLAWAEPGGPLLGDPVRTQADSASRLTGRKVNVPDVGMAAMVHVVTPRGIYVIEADQATITPRDTLDRTRRLAELSFTATPARQVAGPEAVGQIRRRAGVAAACEAVGVAQKMLDLSKEHVSTREQFGRQIGSYQAVSHQVADMFVSLELARSLAYWAAWCVSAEDPQADLAVDAATASAGAAARRCCESAIQVHGGQGFTWDAPLHRWYKRAQWLQAFSGNGRAQRRAIADALLGVGA